jgi:NAD(P)-dependent dehydrogenase (short-subunit alcohol dehydrogenase family)
LKKFQETPAVGVVCNITDPAQVESARDQILEKSGRIDILINNAANNPHVGDDAGDQKQWNLSRLEEFPLALWQQDLAVGLTGAFLCSKTFGSVMAKQNKGVILNIASDLSIIAPDQRLYHNPDLPENQQSVKPVTYSVVKAGIIGLTRYLSTYWTGKGVRANALSFGGVYSSDLDPEFVTRLESLIPLGRMASMSEYKSAIVFMASDASSYLTGQNVVLDGGRSTW